MVVFLWLPGIAVSINCPNCGNALCCRNPGQVHCAHCNRDIFPDSLFNQYLRASVPLDEEQLVIQDVSSLDADNQQVLQAGQLLQFNPTQIISNQNLGHLLSYLSQNYGFGWRRYQANHVFSSISLAQLLILRVPGLSQLGEVEQQLALWWLTGYWLLYMTPDTRAAARAFFFQAPADLHLNAAQQKIQLLQTWTANMAQLPDVISLFETQNQFGEDELTFSAAQPYLNNLGDNSLILTQASSGRGILVIIQQAGTYYIITPFNQLFSATSIARALEILSQIATAQTIQDKFLKTAEGVLKIFCLVAVLGGGSMLPVVVGFVLQGFSPAEVTIWYSACIVLVIVVTICKLFCPFWEPEEIDNDPLALPDKPEEPDELSGH